MSDFTQRSIFRSESFQRQNSHFNDASLSFGGGKKGVIASVLLLENG
ncbi:hypothetical protein [Enterobacter quasihormaechei]|nr:hypothetical protein [Enterobacter quasihormaechei]